jgi:hypothetical protein
MSEFPSRPDPVVLETENQQLEREEVERKRGSRDNQRHDLDQVETRLERRETKR